MLPKYWQEFIAAEGLEKVEIEIPAAADLSQISEDGLDLYIYDEKMSEDEAINYYPGIVVKSLGFIPVASCELGSGDPYFINLNDGKRGPLYRIYHDEVVDENFDKARAVDKVLNNYEELAKYRIT